MSDNTERLLGEVSGKLDSLKQTFERYIDAHDRRHEQIDEKITEAHADINKAKGAKGALLIAAGAVSGIVAAGAAIAERILLK